MSAFAGILFALGALVAWGFGDFFIQRATRTIGVWPALFFIGGSGAVLLGVTVGRERLSRRQWIGAAVAVAGVAALSLATGG